jgi:hypothetical protein
MEKNSTWKSAFTPRCHANGHERWQRFADV